MKIIKFLSLLLIVLTLVACEDGNTLDPVLNGLPPVYQGMQVSNSNLALSNERAFVLSQSFKTNLGINDNIPTLDIPEQENLTYYANRNQDIFVNVRLFNPDGQVILRFTLNGVIYQSFQFEAGSNSELLVVKVNAGNVSGVKELTIDEIKYVENETNTLRDAIFDGNRTIKIGVSYSNEVLATLVSQVVGSTRFQANINIVDDDNLTSIYENMPIFYLFDGTDMVYTQTLSIGTNVIEYSKMHPNKKYEYAIAMTYDLLDGIGKQLKVALNQEIVTESIIEISSMSTTQESISFEIDTNDSLNVGEVSSIELYLVDTLVESLTNLNVRTFTALLSNNAYQIQVTYTYDLNDGLGEKEIIKTQTVTTLAKAIPEIGLNSITSTQDSIMFDINITDIDEVGEVVSIELYQGETLIELLSDLSVRAFMGLLSDSEYTIKVTYNYDLNDGLGEKNQTVTQYYDIDQTILEQEIQELTDYYVFVDGTYYILVIEIVTYYEALMRANNLNGELVIIDSLVIQNIVLDLISPEYIMSAGWIGGYKDDLGNWKWIDGQTIDYSNFDQEMNENDLGAVAIGQGGTWMKLNVGEAPGSFIMQISPKTTIRTLPKATP